MLNPGATLDTILAALTARVEALENKPVVETAPVVVPEVLPKPAANLQGWVDSRIGDWLVESNPWGMQNQPQGNYQAIGAEQYGNGVIARSTWKVAKLDTEVKGYPNVQIGQKPGRSTTTSSYPVLVKDAVDSFTAELLDASVTGMSHLAWNIWLQSSPEVSKPFSTAPLTTEIIIQLDSWGNYSNANGVYPGGRDVARKIRDITLDGKLYAVFQNVFGYGQESGGNVHFPDGLYIPTNNRRFLAIIPYNGATRQLDLAELVKALSGLLRPTDYIMDVECGIELVDGEGDVTWQVIKS